MRRFDLTVTKPERHFLSKKDIFYAIRPAKKGMDKTKVFNNWPTKPYLRK